MHSQFGSLNSEDLDMTAVLYRDIPLTHYQTTNFRLVQIETVCRRQF